MMSLDSSTLNSQLLNTVNTVARCTFIFAFPENAQDTINSNIIHSVEYNKRFLDNTFSVSYTYK